MAGLVNNEPRPKYTSKYGLKSKGKNYTKSKKNTLTNYSEDRQG